MLYTVNVSEASCSHVVVDVCNAVMLREDGSVHHCVRQTQLNTDFTTNYSDVGE